MNERLLALAVPFFVISIIAEAVVGRLLGRRLYRFHDTMASLACGIGQVLTGFWINLIVVAVYNFVESTFALYRLPSTNPWVWALTFIGVDFLHYWFHRSSHRVNFLWAGHAVHHQSEEYNLSTALRQSWLEPLMSLPFYLPLAVLGVGVEVFVVTHTLQTLYQYWIHTRTIGKLGPVDAIFNTPTHHRVHHAINPEYIDKNYAGVFIVWDRLFGTFQPESSTPAYGVVKPLQSFDAWFANAAEWLRIAALSMAARTTSERAYCLFAPPEWRPRSMGGVADVPPVPRDRELFDTLCSSAIDRYVAIQFSVTLVATGLLMSYATALHGPQLLATAIVLLLSLSTFAGLVQSRQLARPMEQLRLCLIPGLTFSMFSWIGAIGGVLYVGGSLWVLGSASRGSTARR